MAISSGALLLSGGVAQVAADPVEGTVSAAESPEEVPGPYLSQEVVEGGEPTPPREVEGVDLPREVLVPGEEIEGDRTATSKTFAGEEPGVFETRVFGSPVHYQPAEGDLAGQWVEIDTDLVADGDGRWVPAANDSGLSIAPTTGEDEDLVTVDLGDGAWIGWSMTPPGNPGGRPSPVPDPVEGEVEGPVVVFEDITDTVGLELESIPGGVKEDLVLASADAPTTYEFELSLSGVDAVEAGGGVHFVDGEGEVVAAVPAGFMIDADGVLSEDVTMTLHDEHSAGVVLRVELDGDWLSEADRVFPVAVDPTVQLVTGVADTHVESNRPSTNFSGYTFMRVGGQAVGDRRAMIRFDMSVLDGKSIDFADLVLYNRASASCTPFDVSLYHPASAWDQATVNWPGPAREHRVGLASTPRGGPGCAPGVLTFRIAEVVRDWTSGELPNRGLLIQTSTSTNAYREFVSSEASANQPYLNVSWRESLLGQLGYYTMNTAQLTDRTQVGVNVANGNVLLQEADVSLPGVAGMDLNLSRFYNSREDNRVLRAGMTGIGWTSNLGQDIRFSVNSFGRDGYFEGPSGYRVVFPYDAATGEYGKPAGLNATATNNQPNNPNAFDYTVQMHETGTKYHFEGGPALTGLEDQRGNTITIGYDGAGKATQVTDSKGGVTTLAYSTAGYLSSVTDPFGRATTYTYSGDELASVTDPTGATTSYGYDTDHNLVSVTDPRGGVTKFAYDSSDRLTQITWADSTTANPVITKYEYPTSTQVIMRDPNNNPWVHNFDSKGRLETFSSPRSGIDEEYAYDAFNSVTQYANSTGGTATLEYDGYNVTSIASDSGAESIFEYDSSNTHNRPSRYTNAQGSVLNYQWANDQEMTMVSNGADETRAQMTYRTPAQSCSGSLATSVDGNGNTTSYTYNARCNLTKIDRPAPAGDITMTYDTRDRVASVTDGKGNRQALTYDNSDRVTKITYYNPGSVIVDAGSVSYTYDTNGNRTSRIDVHGGMTRTSTYTLDARNRLTGEVLPDVTNTYTYDRAGNLASMTTPWGTTAYTYDKENDVASITPPVGGAITFDYYEHTYAAVKFPNSVTDAQHYDTDGRIQRIDQYRYPAGGAYQQLTKLDYDYTGPNGPTGSVYAITDPDYDVAVEYTYDNESRITSSRGHSGEDVFEDNTYAYDSNSNRTGWTIGSDTYTASFNAANQMTSSTRPGGSTSYTYDANGALTSDTAGTSISYDVRNRASSTTHQYAGTLGAQAATYDGSSQVERTSYGATTFRHSLLGIASTTGTDGTRHYVRDPEGRVLAEYRAASNTWRYYLTNHQGSITGATDTTGARTESYGYGPYGEYQYGSGGGTNLIGLRYTGQWLDGTTVTGNGYYHIGLRNYDHRQGRWTQTDPLHRATNPAQPAEANPYNYTGCNPTNQTDPTGAISADCGASILGLGLSVFGSGVALATLIAAPTWGGAMLFLGLEPLGLSLSMESLVTDC